MRACRGRQRGLRPVRVVCLAADSARWVAPSARPWAVPARRLMPRNVPLALRMNSASESRIMQPSSAP